MIRLFHFGKLVGINFLTLAFMISDGILFLFSGYKLFFQYHFCTLVFRFIVNNAFHLSTFPQPVWLWLLLFVFSWATFLALMGRRVY